MKKAPIAFIVAFALSIGFMLLSITIQASLSNILGEARNNTTIISSSVGALFSFLELGAFFAVFYYMAKRLKMAPEKLTLIGILLGAALGAAILFLANTLLYPSTYFEMYTVALNVAVSSVFYLFLPALIALLFAELRAKETANKNNIQNVGVPLGN
jgi:hypothetical protein